MQIKLGSFIGAMAYRFAKRRRRIATVNLRLCFPELDDIALQNMVKRCVKENMIGMMETARAWSGNCGDMEKRLIVEGAEHLHAAIAQGRGVLLVGAHYTTLDLGGVMASSVAPIAAGYSPHKNALMDKFICDSRLKFMARVIDRSDMRGMIRALKKSEVLWYAPDQDYGKKHSVFAPFFGVPAASLRMTAKLAALNDSPVIIISHHREPDEEHYRVRFRAPLENYPTGDEVKDATMINEALEKEIRIEPTQYMWVHRRFKSRPEGEKSVY